MHLLIHAQFSNWAIVLSKELGNYGVDSLIGEVAISECFSLTQTFFQVRLAAIVDIPGLPYRPYHPSNCAVEP